MEEGKEGKGIGVGDSVSLELTKLKGGKKILDRKDFRSHRTPREYY